MDCSSVGMHHDPHSIAMILVARIIGVLLLVGCILFCIFGFIATFEPLAPSTQLFWRIVYGLLGTACLGGIIFLLRAKRT